MDGLSKTINILDKERNTLLYFICERIKEYDPDFEMKFKLDLGPVYICAKLRVD